MLRDTSFQDVQRGFDDLVEPMARLFAWNAPDDEHTVMQLRDFLESAIAEVLRGGGQPE